MGAGPIHPNAFWPPKIVDSSWRIAIRGPTKSGGLTTEPLCGAAQRGPLDHTAARPLESASRGQGPSQGAANSQDPCASLQR